MDLNDWLDLFNEIGSFAGGSTTPSQQKWDLTNHWTTRDKIITSTFIYIYPNSPYSSRYSNNFTHPLN